MCFIQKAKDKKRHKSRPKYFHSQILTLRYTLNNELIVRKSNLMFSSHELVELGGWANFPAHSVCLPRVDKKIGALCYTAEKYIPGIYNILVHQLIGARFMWYIYYMNFSTSNNFEDVCIWKDGRFDILIFIYLYILNYIEDICIFVYFELCWR